MGKTPVASFPKHQTVTSGMTLRLELDCKCLFTVDRLQRCLSVRYRPPYKVDNTFPSDKGALCALDQYSVFAFFNTSVKFSSVTTNNKIKERPGSRDMCIFYQCQSNPADIMSQCDITLFKSFKFTLYIEIWIASYQSGNKHQLIYLKTESTWNTILNIIEHITLTKNKSSNTTFFPSYFLVRKKATLNRRKYCIVFFHLLWFFVGPIKQKDSQ